MNRSQSHTFTLGLYRRQFRGQRQLSESETHHLSCADLFETLRLAGENDRLDGFPNPVQHSPKTPQAFWVGKAQGIIDDQRHTFPRLHQLRAGKSAE